MIVGICGFQGSGKDTIAMYLESKGFKKLSFASILKDIVSTLFGFDRTILEGLTKESREEREIVDPWWSEKLGIPNFSPRVALQLIGTDVFRQNFHKDIWVLALEKQISKYENVVISDCRFKNEISMLLSLNAKMIYVMRTKPDWFDEFKRNLAPEPNLHRSEYDWIYLCPSICIENNSSIDDLYKKIEQIIL